MFRGFIVGSEVRQEGGKVGRASLAVAVVHSGASIYGLTSSNFRSNTSVELGGIASPAFLLPYARLAGTVMRRSPPIAIPATPMSQPLITCPEPSLNENGAPFLFAVWWKSYVSVP